MKRRKYLIFLLFLIFCIAGSGKQNAKFILEDVIKNMEEVNTFKMNLKMEIDSNLYSLLINEEGEYAENSYHAKIVTTISGESEVEEIYEVKKDNEYYTYYSDDEETWFYKVTKSKNQNKFFDTIMNIIKNYKSVKTIDKNDDYTMLEVIIDSSNITDLVGTNDSIQGIDYSKDLILTLLIKDNIIENIDIDLKSILTEEYTKSISKYSMEFNLSNYNSIEEIEIPKEIVEKADLKEV